MRGFVVAALRRLRLAVGTTFYTGLFRVKLWLQGGTAGAGLRVTGPVNLYVHRKGRLKIGARCRFNSGFAHNPVGGEGRLGIWVNAGGVLDIGDGVGVSNATLVCFQSLTIGGDTFIGGGCRIYDTDFHPLDPGARVRGENAVRTAPVVIGERVFVGGHALLLKGARVGDESVVGAGAVLSGEVPPREIWAGNPARCVRKLA